MKSRRGQCVCPTSKLKPPLCPKKEADRFDTAPCAFPIFGYTCCNAGSSRAIVGACVYSRLRYRRLFAFLLYLAVDPLASRPDLFPPVPVNNQSSETFP